jgi:hypothetical protein
MAIIKPEVVAPFASDPTTQADGDLFAVPSFMAQGYTAPGGNPEIPALGNFNWLFWYAMNAARYHSAIGIPKWDTNETEYVAGAAVVRGSDGFIYSLFGTATAALAPQSDRSNWRRIVDDIGPVGYGPWGYSATDQVVSVDTALTTVGHERFRNLTINAGATLTKNEPGIIFVSETLTISSTGKLVFGNKTGALNGSNGALTTRGAAGSGWNHGTTPFHNGGPLLGGGDGGFGGDSSHLTAEAGDNTSFSLGGFGGAGGTANTSALGGGGGVIDAYTEGTPNFWPALLSVILNGHGFGFASGGTHSARTVTPFGLQAGAGGGGGGGTNSNTSAAGGGGGAGGCLGIVIARRAIIAASDCIQSPGGNGGNGFSSGDQSGGGGGGGGGAVVLLYGRRTGPALVAATCCPGGAAGTGTNGGANGVAGDDGVVLEYQVLG